MSKKTLLVLVAVLAALSAAIALRGGGARVPAGAAAAGGALLPGVDLGTVRAVSIADGSATTHLAQAEGLWRVAEEDDHPADLERLREFMRALDDAKNAQVADETPDRLAEFGLAAEGDPAPVRIALEHAGGTAVLSLGKRRAPRGGEEVWRPQAGRYARVGEGPVLLLKDDIAGATADSGQWWDRKLLEVAAESIRKVEIASAEGSFAMERGTNDTFALAGATEGESPDEGAARRLFGALRQLRAESRWPAGDEEAFANAATYRAEADGVGYAIRIGAPRSDRNGGRPVAIAASAAEGATSEQQAAAAAAAKRLNGRAYVVPAYLAEALVATRAELVRKAPPASEAAPESVPESAPVPAEEPDPPPAPADAPAAESAPS